MKHMKEEQPNFLDVQPRTSHEGPEGEADVYLYSFFNLGARWGWVVNATPRLLYPWERHGTHCIASWVGPRTDNNFNWKTQ